MTVSCGAVPSLPTTRITFCNSCMRSALLCSRPAVSISRTSLPATLARCSASKASEAASPPALLATTARRRRPRPVVRPRRSAERVARGQHHRLPFGIAFGQLANGRRLARSVDANHQNHVRLAGGIDFQRVGDRLHSGTWSAKALAHLLFGDPLLTSTARSATIRAAKDGPRSAAIKSSSSSSRISSSSLRVPVTMPATPSNCREDVFASPWRSSRNHPNAMDYAAPRSGAPARRPSSRPRPGPGSERSLRARSGALVQAFGVAGCVTFDQQGHVAADQGRAAVPPRRRFCAAPRRRTALGLLDLRRDGRRRARAFRIGKDMQPGQAAIVDDFQCSNIASVSVGKPVIKSSRRRR